MLIKLSFDCDGVLFKCNIGSGSLVAMVRHGVYKNDVSTTKSFGLLTCFFSLMSARQQVTQ